MSFLLCINIEFTSLCINIHIDFQPTLLFSIIIRFYFCPIHFSYLANIQRCVYDFRHAAENGDIKKVDQMLQDGMPVDVVCDQFGYTAFLLAARYNQLDVAKRLLQAGADINTQTKHGDTSLHLVAMSNSLEFAQLLVEKRADIKLRNNMKETPLDCALGDEVKCLLLGLQQSDP